ncbi:MAG TPA: sugar ABC transporter permease [Gemmatimonadales bacterium]
MRLQPKGLIPGLLAAAVGFLAVGFVWRMGSGRRAEFDAALLERALATESRLETIQLDAFPRHARVHLLRVDAPVVTDWERGRRAAIIPVRDADQWDIVAARVLPGDSPVPAPLPAGPLAGALVVWAGLSFVLGRAIRRRLGRAQPLAVREAVRAWAFLTPSLLHMLVFSIGPILFSLWLSFHEWNLIEVERPFVGFGNYRELLADAAFWRAMRNTAVYVLFVPAGMALALGLAMLVNRPGPGFRLARAAFFLPYITSFVAISLVWKWLFEPEAGLLNAALTHFGLAPQPWLTSPRTALPSLMLMSVWMYAGYMMLIFLAGLQSIPESLYESARLDGAGPWQRFRHITLPLLRPTTFFVLVTMVIFMFQVFTAVYVMTEGGPLGATDVVVYHIYRNAWEYLRMGYASAMSWVLFAVIFVLTLAQFRLLGRATA